MEEGMNEVMQPLGERVRVGGWRFGSSEAERSEGHPPEKKAGRAGSSPFRPLKQKAAPTQEGPEESGRRGAGPLRRDVGSC